MKPTVSLACLMSSAVLSAAAWQEAVCAQAKPSVSTQVRSEFVMTLHAPLFAPQPANKNLLIFHPKAGGYLQGNGWKAMIESPTGDWVRTLPNGSMRIDVRMSAKLDDGEYMYVTYGGLLKKPSAESWARFMKGERIEAPEWYYVITPNFETASTKYAWLNDVQAVGKFVSIQSGEHAHVSFDIYAIR